MGIPLMQLKHPQTFYFKSKRMPSGFPDDTKILQQYITDPVIIMCDMAEWLTKAWHKQSADRGRDIRVGHKYG